MILRPPPWGSRGGDMPSRERGHWVSGGGRGGAPGRCVSPPPRPPRTRAGMMKVMDRRTLVARLREVVGAPHVLTRPEDLVVYEQDAFLVAHASPDIVVLPGAAAEVGTVIALARAAGGPVIARGAGDGL